MCKVTKKTWQNVASNAVEELNLAGGIVTNIHSDIIRRIMNTRAIINWSWDYCEGYDGGPSAMYWEGATEEVKAMLDYAAKFAFEWYDAKEKIEQALQLLQEAAGIMSDLKDDKPIVIPSKEEDDEEEEVPELEVKVEVRAGRPREHEPYEKTTVTFPPEMMGKLRTLCLYEGKQIREVLEYALEKHIKEYEQKHGAISVPPRFQGNHK